jgi:nucleoside-diphosphate-sugar epimerase
MKVIITGASGFVGKNLIASLQHGGNKIISISRAAKGADELLWNDFFDAPEIEVGDAIIHLAGKAHDLRRTAKAQEYFDINTHLTAKLFDAFLASPASTFIYMSSVKAVADTVIGTLTEKTIANPLTPYGQSKHQAESYLLKATVHPGKRVFILRPCMIHGPGNKGNLNLLYKVVDKGIPYPLAAFQNKRSFLSIDNLTFVISRILKDEDIPGGVYNLADDQSLSTNQLIEIIAKASKRQPKLLAIPAKLIKWIAVIGDKLHLQFNTERLTKLTESYEVSNEKIKKALHIDAFPVSVTDGLYNTIRSFKNKA